MFDPPELNKKHTIFEGYRDEISPELKLERTSRQEIIHCLSLLQLHDHTLQSIGHKSQSQSWSL
jgi:hypothetical protein